MYQSSSILTLFHFFATQNSHKVALGNQRSAFNLFGVCCLIFISIDDVFFIEASYLINGIKGGLDVHDLSINIAPGVHSCNYLAGLNISLSEDSRSM
jgi:hypothetical protein